MSLRTRNFGLVIFLNVLVWSSVALPQEPDEETSEPARNLLLDSKNVRVKYENDGTGEIVEQQRWKVLTEAGRGQLGRVSGAYSSEIESLQIEYVRTLKPDGRVVESDLSHMVEVTAPVAQTAPVFSDLKFKVVPVAQVEVGDSVEFLVKRRIHSPLKPGDFWMAYYPTRSFEVREEIFVLDLPADREVVLKFRDEFPPKVKEGEGRRVYCWELSNERPAREDDPPPKPLVAFSTLKDWTEVGQWYWQLQSERTQVTPEIRTLAEKLTAGRQTPRERLEAIYGHVSSGIRYVAISFGIGGFQPHAVSDVLRNGYGDCKDKHALLATLLEAARIQALPVLVNTESEDLEEAVPMPNQFNHVVSYVALEGEEVWLDTTLELMPLGALPEYLRGKRSLLISPSGASLVTLPEFPKITESTSTTMTGRLDQAGHLVVETLVVQRGAQEAGMRQLFRLGNKDLLTKTFNVVAKWTLDEAKAEEPSSSDPKDLSSPFQTRFRLVKADYVSLTEKEVAVEIPNHGLISFPWRAALKEKKERNSSEEGSQERQELKIYGPFETDEELTIEVDPVFRVRLPLPIRAERPFASYESSYSVDEGRVRVRRKLKVRERKIPLAQKPDLASFQKLVDLDLGQKLVFRREGKVEAAVLTATLTADQLNSAGYEAIENHNYELARDLLEGATAKDARHPYAWNNLGRAYTQLGQYEKAEAALKKQIEINPNDEYTYANLGWLYSLQGRNEEAIAALKKQLEINPLDKWVYPNLGQIYEEREEWEEAAHAYEMAARLDSARPELLVKHGHALLRSGKAEEGRRKLDEALERGRRLPPYLNHVAYALAEARTDLETARTYASSAVRQMAAAVHGQAGLEVPEGYPWSLTTLGAYLDTLGWALFQAGEMERAEAYLKAAFELGRSPVVSLHLASLYARRENAERALAYYTFAHRRMAKSKKVPEEIVKYLEAKLGGSESLAKRRKEYDETPLTQRLVQPPAGGFGWPKQVDQKKLEKSVQVQFRVVVDEDGRIAEKQTLAGDEPFLSTALTDLVKVQLPTLEWPGQRIRTVRKVTMSYMPFGNVLVSWELGNEAPAAGTYTSRSTFTMTVKDPAELTD